MALNENEPLEPMPLAPVNNSSTDSTKIDLSLYFPVEILQKIFIRTDDVTLLNLADTCTRFHTIAKLVFSNRYANQYFVIKGEFKGGDPELYSALFNHFGWNITAVKVNTNEYIEKNCWITNMLQPHMHHIKKITFENCELNLNDICFSHVTHWVIRKVQLVQCEELVLRNLVKLEISGPFPSISYDVLKETLRNNPTLQSIKLNDLDEIENVCCKELIILIADHLNEIKELALLYYWVSKLA